MAQVTPKWFTPLTEEKKENPKKFKVGPLNSVQLWEVNTHFKMIDSEHIGLSFEGQKLALKYGLLDWENVKDEDGKDAKCNQANWHLVDSWCLNFAAKEILSLSELADAERKN